MFSAPALVAPVELLVDVVGSADFCVVSTLSLGSEGFSSSNETDSLRRFISTLSLGGDGVTNVSLDVEPAVDVSIEVGGTSQISLVEWSVGWGWTGTVLVSLSLVASEESMLSTLLAGSLRGARGERLNDTSSIDCGFVSSIVSRRLIRHVPSLFRPRNLLELVY